jgi:hypothetical protein
MGVSLEYRFWAGIPIHIRGFQSRMSRSQELVQVANSRKKKTTKKFLLGVVI